MLHKISDKVVCTVLLLLVVSTACKKYLDTKSSQRLSTPSSLNDLQLLLDNYAINSGVAGINEGTDEYYLVTADWLSQPDRIKLGYIWDPQLNDFEDWNNQYSYLLYANTVLDLLKEFSSEGQQQLWNNLKGAALFYRSHIFYELLQIYAKQYEAGTASSDLGIPLRLSSNYNIPTTRATIQQCYDQVINDLKESLSLLPNLPVFKTRPSKAASFALLARTYLVTGNYAKAKESADSSLQIYSQLMDYSVIPNSVNPFSKFNPEVIYYTTEQLSINGSPSGARIDSNLYNSYSSDDLRKTLFFKNKGDGTYDFKGSYNGQYGDLFNGIATDEVYLIRAEANARLDNTALAMQDLNTLMSKRWKNTVPFPAFTAANANDALVQILKERKKELINRGIRWSDLRRLNKEPQFATTLQRNVNSQVYLLPPNDYRYTILIPFDVISITGIQQNPR